MSLQATWYLFGVSVRSVFLTFDRMDGEIDYVQLGITFSHHYGYRREACRAAGGLPMNEGYEAASAPQ